MLSFKEAIRICLIEKYATFSGRARLSEFWWFAFFIYIFKILEQILMAYLKNFPINSLYGVQKWIVFSIVILLILTELVLFIPSVCAGVRRMHDIGHTGWWLLLGLIPIVGWIIILIFLQIPSMQGENKYGPYPILEDEEESTSPIKD